MQYISVLKAALLHSIKNIFIEECSVQYEQNNKNI